MPPSQRRFIWEMASQAFVSSSLLNAITRTTVTERTMNRKLRIFLSFELMIFSFRQFVPEMNSKQLILTYFVRYVQFIPF